MSTHCVEHLDTTIDNQRLNHWITARLLDWYCQLQKRNKQARQRRIDRDAFRRLVTLDDAALRDIGVTRQDVIWAGELPLSQNASLELEKVARGKHQY